MKISRNSLVLPCLAAMLMAGTALGQSKAKTDAPPVAGTASGVVGVTVEEVTMVAHGWSMKRNVLGKHVYNEKNEKIGQIEDVIVTPDKSLSYAILNVGGFLGIGRHEVAIPINQLKGEKDRFVLVGVTKDVLKAMPKFEYAK